jgi:hypothetical protein
MTDYTDPTTIDVDIVLGEINSAFNVRGHTWTDRLSWPHVTVKALADEIERLRNQAAEDIIWISGIGPIPEEGLRSWGEIQARWLTDQEEKR